MLEWIDIRNFVIARHVALDIQPGLSVITGETGAGKSLIMDALSLALGERATGNMVRHGEDRAEIQASFDLRHQPNTLAWLKELELDDEDQCLVRRVIPKSRSSKAFINGRSVPASLLRQLGEGLVDIHSQHEHQSLLRAETQRQILDRFAKVEEAVKDLSQLFDELQQLKAQLHTLVTSAQETQDRLELIQFQLQELDAFAPTKNEWPELTQLHQKLNHAADLDLALSAALDLIEDSEASTAITSLHQAQRQLQEVLIYDAKLDGPIGIIEEAQILINEASQALRQISESSELDPNQLADIEQRFSDFHELARKHRIGPEALYDIQQTLIQEKKQLNHPEEEQLRLLSNIDKKQTRYFKQAKLISKARSTASQTLMKMISESMHQLAMEGGSFNIELTPSESDTGTRYGMEKIQFKVSTNQGMPAELLGKVASGGELSRISLAIQVIIADIATVPTLIFDEVDVGVGGKTAATVGHLLRQLGMRRQVICITHLPQVAARGEHHLSVRKSIPTSDQPSVAAEITLLEETQRVEEIARMVGGDQLTEESLAHARSLITAL